MSKTMTQGELKLTLDLWEMANDFGIEPISPAMWARRYKKGIKWDNAMRTWERLKARIRQSPYPVEFVEVLDRPYVLKHPYHTREDGYSAAVQRSRSVGIKFPRGAAETLCKILDGQNGVVYED